MLMVIWMLGVVAIGWVLVAIGKRAGVMRPTWPDSPPPSAADKYETLHPLLFSFDVFLPFVNLHQEHYWWPDAQRTASIRSLDGACDSAVGYCAATCGRSSPRDGW
jgi:hypothetical protein